MAVMDVIKGKNVAGLKFGEIRKLTQEYPAQNQHDYDLILSAMAGNQKSYAELLSKYRNVIYYLVLKIIKNDRDAEELTIEVFEKAFLKLHQYVPQYAFCTWLYKIAYNYSLDYLRRKAKKRLLSFDDPEEFSDSTPLSNMASPTPDPEEVMMIKQKKDALHSVVKKLKPHYRDIVEMHYFDEYSFVEIKEKLNMPLGTVKIRMFRSREILYNKLRLKKAAI